MATLHHGLLVDPTNSKQIADALLKILTNPEVWDEMSHNGAPTPEAPVTGYCRHADCWYLDAERSVLVVRFLAVICCACLGGSGAVGGR